MAVITFCAYHPQETSKLGYSFQQRRQYRSFDFWQGYPTGNFIEKKVSCLLAVDDWIIHLVAYQLVVFHKPMIWTLGEQQWRHVKGVDKRKVGLIIVKQVFRVVMDDIMSADIIYAIKEMEKIFLGIVVENGRIITKSTNIINHIVAPYFHIHYCET